MRFIHTLLCTLCFTWLVLGGQSPRTAGTSPPAGSAKDSPRPADLTVTGTFQGSYDEAYRSALEAAPDELVAYLRQQGISLELRPSLQDVKKLVERSDEITGPDVGGMTRKVALHLRVAPERVAEMVRLDRVYRTQLRMIQLAKVLAALVAVLAAVAGYCRLDELTKGYYTGWLRLAALGLAGGAVAVLVLIA